MAGGLQVLPRITKRGNYPAPAQPHLIYLTLLSLSNNACQIGLNSSNDIRTPVLERTVTIEGSRAIVPDSLSTHCTVPANSSLKCLPWPPVDHPTTQNCWLGYLGHFPSIHRREPSRSARFFPFQCGPPHLQRPRK